MRRFDIPREPFADLLTAFRSDVDFKGFDTIDDLLGYARYSANPVGRLVLYLFGYRDAERQQLSDLVCSGLQLANFWQDVAVDLGKGRIYFPRARHGTIRRDGGGLARAYLVARVHRPDAARSRRRARDAARGGELHRRVDKRLRRDILMFAGGGLAILRAIERVNYDVFRMRPNWRNSTI